MPLLSPLIKFYFTFVLFLAPTMAVPTGPPNAGESLSMTGALSTSNPDLPDHSTGVDNNAYDQVLHATDVNTGQNPIIEARLWIHHDVFTHTPDYRTAMGYAVEYIINPIQSTILKDIRKDNPSLTLPSPTRVLVYRLSGKDFTNQGDFEISFSGVAGADSTLPENWWFAMPGSVDPSYFGHVDLKCLVRTLKGGYTFKKELVTGKISRRYPGKNEEVLVSFKNGKATKSMKSSTLSRVKTLFGKKPGGASSS
ncbi:MAG: hypothetical protein NXY57DRAFT_495700 [Lentinula lateritia]|nr:MAG: hypothetical protein NXY57DRAFT_495700 [Lentinula lateritia]